MIIVSIDLLTLNFHENHKYNIIMIYSFVKLTGRVPIRNY